VSEPENTEACQIDLAHFLTFPQEYAAVRNMPLAIDRFLLDSRDKPPRVWDTVNERSFMLTGDEKFFLVSTAGKPLDVDCRIPDIMF
jgi:hypothetical protein